MTINLQDLHISISRSVNEYYKELSFWEAYIKNKLLGMSYQKAKDFFIYDLKLYNVTDLMTDIILRVVEKDSQRYTVTRDYKTYRFNIKINNEIITDVYIG